MSTAGDAPPEIEDRLRGICLALPDAYQEQAWVGTRWRVRDVVAGCSDQLIHIRSSARSGEAAGFLPVR